MMCWSTYSPISSLAQTYYSISNQSFLLLPNSYLLTYVIFSGLGAWLASNFFQKSLLGAMALSALGAWIRFFAGSSFVLTLIGQLFMGIAISPLLGFVSVLVKEWFSERERLTVKGISLCSVYIGIVLGYVIPGSIVNGNYPDRSHIEEWMERISEDISSIELIQAILATLPLLIGLFFIKNRPEIAPNFSALVQNPKFPSFKEEVKFLFGLPSFFLNAFVFSVCIGLTFAFPLVTDLLIEPYRITPGHKSVIGVLYITGGFIAKLCGVRWMRTVRKPDYDPIIRILLTSAVVSLFLLAIFIHVLEITNVAFFYIFHSLLGVGLVGLLPFLCNAIGQSSHPVQEFIPINILFITGALLGIVITHFGVSSFIQAGGMFLLAGMALACWTHIVLYYKTEYRKQRARMAHLELDLELEKLFQGGRDIPDAKGFPSVSPIQNKNSFNFLSSHHISKDLISSNPQTPLLSKNEELLDVKVIRSHSNTEHDRGKPVSEGEKLFELMNMHDSSKLQ